MPARLPLACSLRARAGFGLIELMVVIAIVAVLAAIGVPSFRQTLQSNRVQTEANDLVSAINTARGEAVTRSRPVTLCPSTDGATCSGDGDWSTPHQWIVFTDYGTQGVVDPGDEILRVWTAIDNGDALTTTGGTVKWLSFDRTGRGKTDNNAINAPTGQVPQFSFELKAQGCTTGSRNKRVVRVSLLGRVSTDTQGC